MARRKRTSSSIARAEGRAAGLNSIDKDLDLGNELTLAGYRAAIAKAKAALEQYNSTLAESDALLNVVTEQEKELTELSGRMLAGVSSKFGRDSNEYEKAGGTRMSERKSRKRLAAAAAAVAKV